MIGFAGLSHLGIVSSIATASKGFEVVSYDPDGARCRELSDGRLPFFEPGLPELLSSSRARIRFTTDLTALSRCEVIFFSLDVPTDDTGRSDLSALEGLIGSVTAQAAAGAVLIVLSQVPPGFTRKLAGSLKINHNRNLQLFYQVETLIFGRAVERALHPERFIVGCADPHDALPTLYAELLASFNCPILPMRYESAELTKISINMCLVSSISVANTLAEICEAIGADWSEMVPALKLDKRIGADAYLSPGLGIAGGNLERDLATVISMAHEFGTDAGIVDAWRSNSRYRRDWVLKILHSEVLSRSDNPTIAIWGLAYKADTTSTKNSPALALVAALKPFPIKAYDPQVVLNGEGLPKFVQAKSAIDACRGANALAIMTPWREFSSISIPELREEMAGRVIVDPYGALDKQECARAGFSYFRFGSQVQEA